MPQRLFPFVQVEIPFEIGPTDGRWLLRDSASGEVDRIVVLSTVGGRRADAQQGRARRRRPAPAFAAEQPPTLPVTRVTVIDPQPLEDERAAQEWLSRLDIEHEAQLAFGALNRLVHAYRLASADHGAFALSPSHALTLRAGFGEGEEVAEGRWRATREDSGHAPRARRRRRRAALLANSREQRLIALISGRERPLLCEELALRAQGDLDAGRLAHAAIEMERAYAAAAHEIAGGAGLDIRLAELSSLREAVADQAETAITGGIGEAPGAQIDEQVLRHALERLQAALRAWGVSPAAATRRSGFSPT